MLHSSYWEGPKWFGNFFFLIRMIWKLNSSANLLLFFFFKSEVQNVRQKSLRHTFMMWVNILQEKLTFFFSSAFCFWEQFSIFKFKNLFGNLKQVENKNSFHSQNTKEIENRLLPIFYFQFLKNTEKIIWKSLLMNLHSSSNPTSNKTRNFNNFFPLFLSHMKGCFSALQYVEACIDRFQGASI